MSTTTPTSGADAEGALTSRTSRRAADIYSQIASGQQPIRGAGEALLRMEGGGQRRHGRPMHPMALTIINARRNMGLALLALGAVEFVAHWFLPYNGTVMATQTPVGKDAVGRVRQTPESLTVSRMYPQLNIAIGSAIAGAVLLATATWPAAQHMFMQQCSEYVSYLVHLQACFQSMIIVVTVLPLAGVVNVYEMALAAMLTVAQYFIMLFSDMSNQKQLSHWETVDSWSDGPDEDPRRAFRRATTAIEPLLVFNWLPVVVTLLLFSFVWIVIFMHLGDALNSRTYSVEGDFVFVVVATGVLQVIIPLAKVVQIARPRLLVARSLCSYKFVVATIDFVEFINMAFVGIVLMFAYGTLPPGAQD